MTGDAPHTSSDAVRRGVPLSIRIAAAVLFAFVVASAGSALWLAPEVRRLSAADLDRSLESDLDVLVGVTGRALAAGDAAALESLTQGAAVRGTVRVTVMRPDGEVVAESEHRLPLASHADRPEFVEALARGRGRSQRRSTTTGEEYVYAARKVEGPDGRTVGVLRVARPLATVAAIDRKLFQTIVASSLVGIPVAALVGWLAARRIARPLEAMTEAAARMAGGDFSRPPRVARSDESGRLAEALARLGDEFSSMLRVRDQARGELSAILESMSEGVLAVDGDARVLHANAAVAQCLGLAAVPAPGTPLAEVVRLPEISTQLRTALAGKRAAELDVKLPGAAGRVLGVGAAPVVASDGAARGAVLVLRDVTVIRRLERTRLDFVANVSHELRTPLAAVLGAVETLRDLGEEEPEARAKMLETAERHGRRLASIVDDLLALSQIESEGDRLERASVPLLRTIRAAASAVAADARSQEVAVVVPPADAADLPVLGNEGRLEQVWTNLLTNAVKYNRRGGTVEVAIRRDPAGRMAVAEVRDTGQGIASEHLPRIFERFYRVDRGRSRDQGGTGLGLAIVKHIVLAHRGRIEVESRPGAGSVFRVLLPLAPDAAAPAAGEGNLTTS